MNKDTLTRLEVTAQSLPRIMEPVFRHKDVLGKVLRVVHNVTKHCGEIVRDNVVYPNVKFIIRYDQVDHLRALKRIFKNSGWDGVKDYQKKVYQQYREQHPLKLHDKTTARTHAVAR